MSPMLEKCSKHHPYQAYALAFTLGAIISIAAFL